MFIWIAENIATVIICLVIVLMVAGAIAVLVRDKKKGRSSCGCQCGSCPMSDACHSTSQKKKETKK